MIRPRAAGIGFESRPAPVASSRLIKAVAASLAIGAVALCAMVAATAMSINASVALPI